jgi:hypothetical protein
MMKEASMLVLINDNRSQEGERYQKMMMMNGTEKEKKCPNGAQFWKK